MKNERLRIDVQENNKVNAGLEPLYDENRNLLIQNCAGFNSYLGDEIKGICYVGGYTKEVMKGMAWALLAMYAFTFLMLLIWSLCCRNRYSYNQLGGYWKFLLHMWAKLQMVSFFICLAVL